MAKETSQNSQDLFRLIAENIHDFAVFATDLDGRIVSWNPGVGSLLGFAEGEWVGRDASIIFTPEDRERGAHLWEMETALRAGYQMHVTKPVELTELAAVVASLAKRSV